MLYTAEATATGGRNGHMKSNNGVLYDGAKTLQKLTTTAVSLVSRLL